MLRLYGPIRTTTFAFLTACREECIAAEQAPGGDAPVGGTRDPGRYRRARYRLSGLARLLQEEHRLALDALDALERFRQGERTDVNNGVKVPIFRNLITVADSSVAPTPSSRR